MRIAASGGVPVPDGLNSGRFAADTKIPALGDDTPRSFDISPDGARVALGHRARSTEEGWAIDNLMSFLRDLK